MERPPALGREVAILALDVVDSTNAEAARRAQAGETGPLWISARRQMAGRGRRGRTWETGEGNLAASLLMLTDHAPADAARISFIAALAVCDLVRHWLPGDRVKLKWPNDVLIEGRKTAGVLIESGFHASGSAWLIVGVGVNIAQAPVNPERPATCLADHDVSWLPTPGEALDRLAAAFSTWLWIWDAHGFAAIAEAWTARAHGLGQACTARLNTETIEGIAEGLESDGALRLRPANGPVRRITAGDVYFGAA